MSLKTYRITLIKIETWPPKKDKKKKYSSGLSMRWNHIDGGGNNSGSTPIKKVEYKGVRDYCVGDATIIFDENSFELSVNSGESETSEKNRLEFELQHSELPLTTADIDFAKPEYIVQDSKEISVAMKTGKIKPMSPPKLWVKIERIKVKIERIEYINMYKKSIEDPAKFWYDIASKFGWEEKKENWGKPVYSENLDGKRKGKIKIEWFKGGLTNICYNCLDKNIKPPGNKGNEPAFLWEGTGDHGSQRLTYKQLLDKVCQVANFLKDKCVKEKDNVIIYLPMIMELPITMLACARIGAVHSVVVPGYSKKLLSHIIKECEPKIVVTCNALIENVHDALSEASNVKFLVLVDENESAMTKDWPKGRYFNWKKEVPKCPTTCDVKWVGAEHPLFILYTGRRTDTEPKGIKHTSGGYMIYAATTFKYAFDYKDSDDVYWCTADCGWITGHSYVVYGPLLNGAKVVLYEGVLD